MQKLSAEQTEAKILECDRLPSLGSINFALQSILSREDASVQQISESVSRDPSLTTRVLRLTNSPFYGLRNEALSLDQAIFYLGVTQIQRLVMASPIIDQFAGVAEGGSFSWKEFWKHSMAVATVSQELFNFGGVGGSGGQSGYLAGLVHDIGKIAIAISLPEEFLAIHRAVVETERELCEVEREFLGLDHAEVGSLYFKSQKMPGFLIHSTRYHHRPSEAEEDQRLAAVVYIANLAVRGGGIGASGAVREVKPAMWKTVEAWKYVNPSADSRSQMRLQRNIDKLLFKLPNLVAEMVADRKL